MPKDGDGAMVCHNTDVDHVKERCEVECGFASWASSEIDCYSSCVDTWSQLETSVQFDMFDEICREAIHGADCSIVCVERPLG